VICFAPWLMRQQCALQRLACLCLQAIQKFARNAIGLCQLAGLPPRTEWIQHQTCQSQAG
jgi:hypothetical protein